MNVTKYSLDNFKKFPLHILSVSHTIIDLTENILASEDESIKHCFHKVTVHDWPHQLDENVMFDTLMDYFSCAFIPVRFISQGDTKSFYTSSLSLISKIMKFDFIFLSSKNRCHISIVFNDKSSYECFNEKITVDDIVNNVVFKRLTGKSELNLSNFCNDTEFIHKKLHFYKLGLLSNFKLLMLRIGRETKSLNLSSNNLSAVPVEIFNFFIKCDLTSVNLSHNNIPSLNELTRVSSKIEKLWIEGNPLCEDIDAVSYVKQIVMKFPRLIELDGVNLDHYGIIFPFIRSFLETANKKTEFLVENFLQLYFTHYDSPNRKNIAQFYDVNATLTINTKFNDAETSSMPHYVNVSRNILTSLNIEEFKRRCVKFRNGIMSLFAQFPISTHIPSTFIIDVLKHDAKNLIIIIDGVFKEKNIGMPEIYLHFRRTFIFKIVTMYTNSKLIVHYFITNEMFTILPATKEQIDFCMQNPARKPGSLMLVNPNPPEKDALCKAFSHITQLKGSEAEMRLKNHGWDIKEALQEFISDVRINKVSAENFTDSDENVSLSSLIEDEID